MPLFKKKPSVAMYLLKNVYTMLGIVLIWRGVWYALDWFDITFVGGHHLWTAIVGVAAGILLLYLPDKDLKEIEQL